MRPGGSGDGRAGGRAERADDSGDGGDPEEGVRRAGGHRETVDDGLQAQRLSEQDLKLPLNLISSLKINQQDLKLR